MTEELTMDLQANMTEFGGWVVNLKGDLDALSVPHLRGDLEAIVEDTDKQQVVLDLSRVDFIDSSGIGAIVFLFKRLKAQRRVLELSGVRDQPKQLLELLRIHQVITIHTTVTTH
jgi:anti-anti-sigma factor